MNSFFSVSALVLAASFVACSSASSGGAVPAPLAPDVSSFTATWKPDTVVLDDATVKSALRNPMTADGIYLFDPTLSQVAAMKPGQALVLTGVDLVKVDSVAVQSDAIVVTTEPASLLDAATDANVSWDIGADMANGPGSVPEAYVPGLRLESDPQPACDPTGDAGPCTPSLSFSGMIGNLATQQVVTFGTDGSMKMVASFTLTETATDGFALSAKFTATLKSFRHTGSVVIMGGVVQQASIALNDIDIDLDIQLNALNLGVSDGDFNLPLAITFPFSLGPIPAYFTVSASVKLNPSLSGTSLVKTSVQHHIGGALGLQVNGPSVVGTGSIDSVAGAAPVVSNSAAVCTVTAGMGMLTQYPKVAFGIGVAKLASAEVYLLGKEEIIVNDVIDLDKNLYIIGNCLTVQANTGAYYGGAMRLIGLTFKQEQEFWGKTRQVLQTGNPSTSAACH